MEQPPPGGGYGAPPTGGYGAPPPSGGYGAPPPPSGYGAQPHGSGYGTQPHGGGYGAPQPAQQNYAAQGINKIKLVLKMNLFQVSYSSQPFLVCSLFACPLFSL